MKSVSDLKKQTGSCIDKLSNKVNVKKSFMRHQRKTDSTVLSSTTDSGPLQARMAATDT